MMSHSKRVFSLSVTFSLTLLAIFMLTAFTAFAGSAEEEVKIELRDFPKSEYQVGETANLVFIISGENIDLGEFEQYLDKELSNLTIRQQIPNGVSVLDKNEVHIAELIDLSDVIEDDEGWKRVSLNTGNGHLELIEQGNGLYRIDPVVVKLEIKFDQAGEYNFVHPREDEQINYESILWVSIFGYWVRDDFVVRIIPNTPVQVFD